MKLHRNVLHKLLCSTECDKCVCTSVKGTDVGLCVVVVFVEKLEISQHLYIQGRFRGLKMQNLSNITEKYDVVYSNTDMSRNEQIFFKRTLYNLTSYPSSFSHALKI